jgi:hypothetical protein
LTLSTFTSTLVWLIWFLFKFEVFSKSLTHLPISLMKTVSVV